MSSNLRRKIFSKRRLFAGVLIAVVLLAACSRQKQSDVERLLELVPDLPPDVARMLVTADDSTLVRFAREVGPREMAAIAGVLGDAKVLDSRESFERSSALLQPIQIRMYRATNAAFGTKVFDHDSLVIDDDLERQRLRLKLRKLVEDRKLAELDKAEQLKKLLAEAREGGYPWVAAQCEADIGGMYAIIGRGDEAKKYCQMALADFRTVHNYNMQCQILGVLGVMYEDQGQVDSVVICWEEAKAIARDNAIPMQLARIHTFYANYYKKRGRLSLSHDLFNEAMEVCREGKVGMAGLGLWTSAMSFHADLGAWDVIGRLLPQARAIERQHNFEPAAVQSDVSLKISQIEARYLMQKGRADEAEAILKAIKQPVDDLPHRNLYPFLLENWARGLLDNSRPGDAIPLIQEGYQHAVEIKQSAQAAGLLMLLAEAEYEMNNIEASKRALEQFEQLTGGHRDELRSELIARDVLRVKFNLIEGNDHGVVVALHDAVVRWTDMLTRTDAGVHGYLWMGACDDIRQLLHDCVAADPLFGYGIEFYWRDACRLLGSYKGEESNEERSGFESLRTANSDGDILRQKLREYAETARDLITDKNAVHCVYAVRGAEVWRWTCSKTKIRRDVLDLSTENLRDLVSKTWKKMSRDPGDWNAGPDTELVGDLKNLARSLLPAEILENEAKNKSQTLFVTADGFLAQFPFETLNVDDGVGYTPLLMRRDVAYIRHCGAYEPHDRTPPGLVLSHARGGERIRDRVVFVRDLEQVIAEGETVVSLNPGSKFLRGESATKASLLAGWGDASFVYLATHVIRDPDAPYMVLIPLANPGGQLPPDASYLDMSDVRAADLNGCDVVVLSGCSSGAPYVGSGNTAPSLGDAFLDAGAGTVIQTFWDVGDEEAKEQMTAFTREWGNSTSASAMIKALCKTRRDAMSGKNGVRHPFNWAAYCIKIGRL